ncbi:hypothetical protein CL620_00575 [archaeon]|nr:hypothetical protein [archaeon]
MEKRLFFFILCLFLLGCSTEEMILDVEEPEVEKTRNIPVSKEEVKEIEKTTTQQDTSSQKVFRIEIPTKSERERLPSCDTSPFTTFPVDMNDVTSITPLGNLGPPGHTFPTQHPHLHFDQSGKEVEIVAPADIYLTAVAWSNGITQDPRDYTIYFSVCNDIIAYYNHVKTISPELQTIFDTKKCESFSVGQGCTKILDLEKIEEGTLLGTVGLRQGNWDFGLIDLRKPLDFVKPKRYPERDRYLQCVFDYYPPTMKDRFYSLLDRDDGTCSTTMQDVPGTLQGNWFHESADDEYVVEWDVFLAFVGDFEFSGAQVVSVAGKFTDASKYEFYPKSTGNMNRDFSHVKPGGTYCYQGEDIGRSFTPIPDGKIVVKMVDEMTLHITHQEGRCTGAETLHDFEVYKR